MTNLTDQKIKVKHLNGTQVFGYTGKFISEDDLFMCIEDSQAGTIWLSKRFIISYQVVE